MAKKPTAKARSKPAQKLTRAFAFEEFGLHLAGWLPCNQQYAPLASKHQQHYEYVELLEDFDHRTVHELPQTGAIRPPALILYEGTDKEGNPVCAIVKHDPDAGTVSGRLTTAEEAAEFHQQSDVEQKGEAVYLGEGRLRIGAETMVFEGQESFVLESLVELQAATKTQLESKSGVSDAVRILKRMVKKHDSLKAYVVIPGTRGAGGYRTSIQRG